MAPRRALNERLEALQAELAASQSLSRADRARLEQLIADLRPHAAEGEDPTEEPHTLSEQLQEATEQFGEEHPKLTLAIGAVADALSRIGI